MRRSVLAVLIAGAVALLVVGCSKQEGGAAQGGAQGAAQGKQAPAGAVQGAKEKVAQTAQGAADAMAQEKDNMVGAITKMLDDVQAGINEMADAAQKKGAQAKADFDQKVKPELDKRLANAKSSLEAAKAATADAWAGAKDKLTSAVSSLQQLYQTEKAKLAKPAESAAPSGGNGS